MLALVVEGSVVKVTDLYFSHFMSSLLFTFSHPSTHPLPFSPLTSDQLPRSTKLSALLLRSPVPAPSHITITMSAFSGLPKNLVEWEAARSRLDKY